MNVNALKDLCTSGGYYVFMEAAEAVLNDFKDVPYNPDPYRLSFNHGKREGAEQFLDELKSFIEKTAKS
jgi:hypothetical protein